LVAEVAVQLEVAVAQMDKVQHLAMLEQLEVEQALVFLSQLETAVPVVVAAEHHMVGQLVMVRRVILVDLVDTVEKVLLVEEDVVQLEMQDKAMVEDLVVVVDLISHMAAQLDIHPAAEVEVVDLTTPTPDMVDQVVAAVVQTEITQRVIMHKQVVQITVAAEAVDQQMLGLVVEIQPVPVVAVELLLDGLNR
jgi:hypothetical protein